MKKILLLLFFGISSANAADFTIQLQPASNSVSDSQVSSISNTKVDGLGSLATKSTITNSEVADGALSSSKISNFVNDVISAMSSTLSNYVLKNDIKPATMSRITTTGPTTYNTPSGVLYLKVRIVGGGGGGGASGNIPGTAQGGGITSFRDLAIASGGLGGGNGGAPGGNGGSASIHSSFTGNSVAGAYGSPGTWDINGEGGVGGSTAFGGAGGGGARTGSGADAKSNSGSGGGGAGGNATYAAGSGGGAGAYVEIIVPNPDSSYLCNVGIGGQGASAGGGGYSGGNGAPGYIEIMEYYQ